MFGANSFFFQKTIESHYELGIQFPVYVGLKP